MKSFSHVYKAHRILKSARYPVPFSRMQTQLDCSTATVKRVLAYLRDELHAPLETCREPRGYRYADSAYELPGFWFSAEELQALLGIQHLLKTFRLSLLDDTLAVHRSLIDRILRAQGLTAGSIHRVRLLKMAAREPGDCFASVASAVLQRQRLTIDYVARGLQKRAERTVSPQRLVHYRDNWYLDAWCHTVEGLRTFALDGIRSAVLLSDPALDIEEQYLDEELSSAYGIFSGKPDAVAVLRFSPQRARWVSEEQWHPQQQGTWQADGSYLLRVPYKHPEELILDILRYGPEVEVIEPHQLRAEVVCRLEAALQRYR